MSPTYPAAPNIRGPADAGAGLVLPAGFTTLLLLVYVYIKHAHPYSNYRHTFPALSRRVHRVHIITIEHVISTISEGPATSLDLNH